MGKKESEEQLKRFVESNEGSLNSGLSLQNNIGWVKLNLSDLPTKGMFYYDGTEIAIKAATGGEIRHWSTLNEEDVNGVDDMLNYVLERCCTVKIPNVPNSNWRDIVELDRFYIILAIRELTFKSENPLQVPIGTNKSRPVTKEMISFANFDGDLMKFYDKEQKCFLFRFKTGNVRLMMLPTLGITAWLKQYVMKHQQKGSNFDMDFMNFAPFLLDDWRGLTDKTYESLVSDSVGWDIKEVSLISKVREMIINTINPEIVYLDEHGSEVRVPINFLGGFKSIFVISDIFAELL